MLNSRARLLILVALVAGAAFYMGGRAATKIDVGRADSTAAGGGSISTDSWT